MTAAQSTAPPKLFDVLLHRLDNHTGHQIRLSDLLTVIGDRGFGLAFILFGLLAAALPTGLCSIMGLPIIIFAFQLLIGRNRPTIPDRFNHKLFDADLVRNNIQKSQKWLYWLEHFAKPRWQIFNNNVMIRLSGLICLCLALIIMMPGPFTNMPTGLAVMVFGMAIAERDGLLLLLSYFVAISAFFVSITAFVAFISLIQQMIS